MKVFKILSLWGSQVFIVLFNLGVQLFLARLYMQEDVGTYFSLIALLNIAATVGQFGLNKYLLIIYTKYENITLKSKYNLISLFLLLNGLGLFIYIALTYLFYPNNLIFAFLISPLFLNNSLMPVYTTMIQVKSKYVHISLIKLLVPFIKVISIVTVGFLMGSNIFWLGLSIFILSGIFSLYLVLNIYYEMDKFLDENISPSLESKKLETKWKTIKILTPYAILNLTFMIYTQGNTFMLGALSNERNVALFANAYLILNAIYIFPTIIYQKVLAHHIFKMMYQDREKILSVMVKHLNKLLIFIASILIVVLYSVSDQLILLLFGPDYKESSIIFQLLLIAIPFRLISISVGTIMSTDFFIKKRVSIEIILALLSISLNIILINYLGIKGVVLTVIIIEFILAIALSYFVDRKLSITLKEKTVYLYLLLPYSYMLFEKDFVIFSFIILVSVSLSIYYMRKLNEAIRKGEQYE